MDTGTGIMSTNMYAYCRNDPVNFCDPSGLWDKVIHKEATLEWALSAGFNLKDAGVIASADNNTDIFKLVIFEKNRGAHFRAHGAMDYYKTHYDNAVVQWKAGNKNEALQELGTALHALQDNYAHLDWHVDNDAEITKSIANASNLKNHPFAQMSHLSWSPDMLEWSTTFFDDPDYDVWSLKSPDVSVYTGFYYHEFVGRLNNPRYLASQLATDIVLKEFIKATGYRP